MVIAVFLFAFLGLEHSVANTALFLIYGLQDGINVAAAVGNVAIALIGNFIGGGIMIGSTTRTPTTTGISSGTPWLLQTVPPTSTGPRNH